MLALLLAAGCSGRGTGTSGETGNTGSASGTTNSSTGGSSSPEPETTQEAETTEEAPGSTQIEQVSSGSDGLKRPQVVVAQSAAALSEATGVQIPEAGEGTYLAAFWGERPTGGYTVEILDARMEGGQVAVQLALRKPPPDAMVSQALTYPYAAAVTRGGVPESTDLTFVAQGGRELGWPVRRG
ncbi:MAG: protease complex subunit PrcB family protein [Rubrobacteraceae bacterium]